MTGSCAKVHKLSRCYVAWICTLWPNLWTIIAIGAVFPVDNHLLYFRTGPNQQDGSEMTQASARDDVRQDSPANDTSSYIKQAISKLRVKLLDLTNRNALLNFRHSDKSLSHLRVIDELPDFLYASLVQGKKLTFLSLPELDQEPHDEKIPKFQDHLRVALVQDEDYLSEIKKLEDQDDAQADLIAAERKLRNRLRTEFGMPPVSDLKPLTNAQWAKQNGLDPKYDLPLPNEDDYAGKHFDEFIQTLYRPKELLKKLQGIKRYIHTDISETGVNTFYAAFGFLERYEADNSQRPYFSPLVLLQLDELEDGRSSTGAIQFSVKASGETAQYNLPLAEKLKEFGLTLPALAPEDTPELYLKKVELLISSQPGWRVRRYITIGRFQFSRLVMYNDLDPASWPSAAGMDSNKIIAQLIAGGSNGDATPVSEQAEVYDIDNDLRVERAAPFLVVEADSSQHSAIVDAIEGRNLVIKGPPGTGKSQTITNLIANALAKEKKVLFIAEKMAALNVVYSRLCSVGLGDYCLELHSTKTKIKDIKDNLAWAIENRTAVRRPANLPQHLSQLKIKRSHLRAYSDALNKETDDTQLRTGHDILWAEQRRRIKAETLPISIKRLQMPAVSGLDEQQLKDMLSELLKYQILQEQFNAYPDAKHPWYGVTAQKAAGTYIRDIIQSFEEAQRSIDDVSARTAAVQNEFGWHSLKSIADWEQAKVISESIASVDLKAIINPEVLQRLSSKERVAELKTLLVHLNSIHRFKGEVDQLTYDSQGFLTIAASVEFGECLKLASDMKISNLSEVEISEAVVRAERQMNQWRAVWDNFNTIRKLVFKSPGHLLDFKSINLLVRAMAQLEAIDGRLLQYRTSDLLADAALPILTDASVQINKINALKSELSEIMDIGADITDVQLAECIRELSNHGLFSIFRSTYRAAKRLFQSVSLKSGKFNPPMAVKQLRLLKGYREEIAKFTSDNRYSNISGNFYNGIQTNFGELIALNRWASNVRDICSVAINDAETIRDFLLYAGISELKIVREEASRLDVQLMLEGVDGSASDLDALLAGLREKYEKLKKVQEYLLSCKARSGVSFSGMAECQKTACTEWRSVITEMESKEDSYSALLGSQYSGQDTNPELLAVYIKIADGLQVLKFPQELDEVIYSARFFSFISQLNLALREISRCINSASTIFDGMIDMSGLDCSLYLNQNSFKDAPLSVILEKLRISLEHREALGDLLALRQFMGGLEGKPYRGLIEVIKDMPTHVKDTAEIFEYLYYRQLARQVLEKHDILNNYAENSLETTRNLFREIDHQILSLNSKELAYKLAQRPIPEGNSHGRVSEYTEMGLIRHQALKEKVRSIPLRSLISRSGRALQALKPCFLMSPLSVAQYIDPKSVKFDLVVIDEASQMRPEDALGAIARSGQIVIVGDPKQLPPTDFFQTQISDDDMDPDDSVDNESILDLALGRFRPTRDLQWHYRSRHESLIAFSNLHFYDNRLIVFPAPESKGERFGVYSRYIKGTYQASCNLDEVKAVTDAAAKFMREHPDKSLGIATMNSSQRDLIDDAMNRLFAEDTVAENYRIKWKDTLEPFFVKNLESVQGDERDVIYVSTVYGPDKQGTVMQRFGPINGRFGHRRLNVLFTRAKHNLVVFTSLKPDDIKISEGSSLGLKIFKAYLQYAADGLLDSGTIGAKECDSDFEVCVKERLESIGCEAIPQVGVAGYFIDLGVKHPDYPYGFLLGIECDGAAYHSSKSARDRDRIRQNVLEGLGWSIYRIWSTDWFHNPEAEFSKLKTYIETLIAEKRRRRKDIEAAHKEALDTHLADAADLLSRVRSQQDEQEEPQNVSHSDKDTSSRPDSVELFDTVEFHYINDLDSSSRTVTIVRSQSDTALGNINQNSALGQALLGSSVGDEVDVALPAGNKVLVITALRKTV